MSESQLRVQTLFQQAASHHLAGQLAEAELAYREALALDPDHPESLHGFGLLAHQRGRADVAIGYIGKALQLKPRQPGYLLDLGRALRDRGHTEEARAALHCVVILTPEDPVARATLGATLDELGRTDEALEHYRHALRLDPSYAEACAQIGLLLHRAGKLPDAEACFHRLTVMRPRDAAAHALRAAVLRQLQRLTEAEASIRHAVQLDPGNPDYLNILAAMLIDLGRPDEALTPVRAALATGHTSAEAHNNLGLALQNTGQLEPALQEFQRALQLQPDNHAIRNNLAIVLRDLGYPEQAEETWRQVLADAPLFPSAHFNLATLLLSRGDFATGWAEFEWRDRMPGARPRSFSQPRWRGEPLGYPRGDGVLLIHAEQGLGDTLQFCRFVLLATKRSRVVLEVPSTLVRLLARLEQVDRVVAQGDPLPAFQAHCPMLSLPAIFGTGADTIPADIPYLTAPASSLWASRVNALRGLRVGLCWAGNRTYSHDRWRSLSPAACEALSAVPGVSFVSLLKDPRESVPGWLHDWTADLSDFADTASLIAELDLVISVDTAVAHLAGTLGKPVWLLNRFVADWRWLRDRDDSPWYPTLRQFRQPTPGDWSSVLQNVARALACYNP